MKGPMTGIGSAERSKVQLFVKLPGQAEMVPALERTDTKRARGIATDDPTKKPTTIYIKTVQAVGKPVFELLETKFKRPAAELLEMCESGADRRKAKSAKQKVVDTALRERELALKELEYHLAAEKVWGSDRSLVEQQEEYLLYREPWSSALARKTRSTRKPRAAQSARNIKYLCPSAVGDAFRESVGLNEQAYWDLPRTSDQEQQKAKEYDIKKMHFYSKLSLQAHAGLMSC